MDKYKIKQITNSLSNNGKSYTLAVTTCGRLLEFTQSIDGTEEWRVIKIKTVSG